MASELDKLVEAITELVLEELRPKAPQKESSEAESDSLRPKAQVSKRAKVLVAPGSEFVEPGCWKALSDARMCHPVVYVWNGFRQDQLPAEVRGNQKWPLETRTSGWSEIVSGYSAVCLLGLDLPLLGSLSRLGAGGSPPAGLAISAVASGLPVFVDGGARDRWLRHSSRLPSSFVRDLEEAWRTVVSYGVIAGGPQELEGFLRGLGSSRPSSANQVRVAARDVVTVEDVEAARQAGSERMSVSFGAIVTPLARQRAEEWGMEVEFL